MSIGSAWIILPAAFILDLLLGDPRRLPHPIRWMGTAITVLEPCFRNLISNLIFSGMLFAVSLVLSTWALTALVITVATVIHPALASGLEIVLIFYTVSARSLESEAMAVRRHLDAGRLADAKARLSGIVGRDVTRLTESGISRAAVETVAENLVDGIIAPLFYAAIGGAPLAMAYKMVNTLDSMVGYKNETYRDFGKAAARIDDAANFIPARLSVPVIALAAKFLAARGGRSLATALREGANHSSPNAGYPEAAFAGALGVKLGGPNVYHGKLVDKPYIGTRFNDTKPEHIKKACDLMMLASFLWLGLIGGLSVFYNWIL